VAVRHETGSESRQRLAEAQRAWLQRVTRDTGLTLTEIARKAGKHHTTLTNFMNKPDRGPLNPLTITLVAEATGVPASAEARGTPAPEGLAEEAEPYLAGSESPLDLAVRALVAARPGVDPWRLRTHALEDAGYLMDDIVIVDLNATPRAGDAVCAQLYDWPRGRAETIWRIFEPPYLVTATNDPALRKPILVDDDRVVIKGVLLPSRLRPTTVSRSRRVE